MVEERNENLDTNINQQQEQDSDANDIYDFEDWNDPLDSSHIDRSMRSVKEKLLPLEKRACIFEDQISLDIDPRFSENTFIKLQKSTSKRLYEYFQEPSKEYRTADKYELFVPPGERTKDWIYKDMEKLLGEIGELLPESYEKDYIKGTQDFIRNFLEMRAKNFNGADKYYHCMANCESTQRGPGGWTVAIHISALRELTDIYREQAPKSFGGKGKNMTLLRSLKNSLNDMRANLDGQMGAIKGSRCYDACRIPHRPLRLK